MTRPSAQNSWTVSYVSNQAGNGTVKLEDGIYTPNFFGLRDSEDIGGGTHVVFRLVDLFEVGTGSVIPLRTQVSR